jgi:hypothetical protein
VPRYAVLAVVGVVLVINFVLELLHKGPNCELADDDQEGL